MWSNFPSINVSLESTDQIFSLTLLNSVVRNYFKSLAWDQVFLTPHHCYAVTVQRGLEWCPKTCLKNIWADENERVCLWEMRWRAKARNVKKGHTMAVWSGGKKFILCKHREKYCEEK